MRCHTNSGTHSYTPTHYSFRWWHTHTHTEQWGSPSHLKIIHFRQRASIWQHWASVSHASCHSVLLFAAAKSNFVCVCVLNVVINAIFVLCAAYFNVLVWSLWLHGVSGCVFVTLYYSIDIRWRSGACQQLLFSSSAFLVYFICICTQ